LLQVRASVVLDSLDQKAQIFIVLIIFTRWFSEHARKVFDEISVRP
jgi:hypothetical protein